LREQRKHRGDRESDESDVEVYFFHDIINNFVGRSKEEEEKTNENPPAFPF
jgi:hypothetical protein